MRRRYLTLFLVLLLLAGIAALVQYFLFPPAPKTLEVLSVRGEVTVEDPVHGKNPLLAGAKLNPGESVKTGHEGEAVLQGKGNSTITVSEHSNVRLDGISSDGVARFGLTEGRMRTVVPDGSGGGVEVSGGNENASLLNRGGDVAVGVDGAGDLAVAAFRGNPTLSAGGTTTELKPGQLAVVSRGKVQIDAIPTAILLKVAWPEVGKTRDPIAKVSVVAPAGSMVRFNEMPVHLDSAGRGTLAVKLEEGENRIHLEGEDVAGNPKKNEDSGLIVLDTRPPTIKGGKARWK